MCNLYARLVTGENARTEALADLLERILAHDRETGSSWFARFVSRVLLTHATGVPEREGIVRWLNEPSAALSVKTQYQIDDGKKPDMVIFDGDDPMCVVEVKIGAPIAEGQLEGYGRWLAARAGEAKAGDRCRPALVLLTAGTPAPSGFIDHGCTSFGVALRGVASWNKVAEWFAELGRRDGVNEPLKSLAKEFGEFLREDAMMPTLVDVLIARQYLAGSEQRLKRAVENMQANFPFPPNWTQGKRLMKPTVGIWKHHHPQGYNPDQGVYCGLGLKPVDERDEALRRVARYENQSAGDPTWVVIGDGVYAFVYTYTLSAKCDLVPGFTEDRWYERQGGNFVPVGNDPAVDSRGWWHYYGKESGWAGYARICPLQDLLDDDGRLGRDLQDWTHKALEKTKELWNALSLGGGWGE